MEMSESNFNQIEPKDKCNFCPALNHLKLMINSLKAKKELTINLASIIIQTDNLNDDFSIDNRDNLIKSLDQTDSTIQGLVYKLSNLDKHCEGLQKIILDLDNKEYYLSICGSQLFNQNEIIPSSVIKKID